MNALAASVCEPLVSVIAKMNSDGLSQFRGHAGEMYVSAELMRRGWLAAMTARGSRSFDILARRPDRPSFVAIRVKTGHNGFIWSAKKDGTLFLDMTDTADFTVIVDLPEDRAPTYYVLPTTVVDACVRTSHATWLQTPGKKGQPHSAKTTTRGLYLDGDTTRYDHGFAVKWADYRDAWHLLDEGATSASTRAKR